MNNAQDAQHSEGISQAKEQTDTKARELKIEPMSLKRAYEP